MKLKKEIKVNGKKIIKYLGFILFMIMLILIYIVSPKITNVIQNIAKFLYELDSVYITRVVELILATSFSLSLIINKKKE